MARKEFQENLFLSYVSAYIGPEDFIFLKNRKKKNFLKELERGFLCFGSMKTGQTEFHRM